MVVHQLQMRIVGIWRPVGARMSCDDCRAQRKLWIDEAACANGPDAAQYVRAHSRVIRHVETFSSTVIEEG